MGADPRPDARHPSALGLGPVARPHITPHRDEVELRGNLSGAGAQLVLPGHTQQPTDRTYITPEASRITFGEFAEVYLGRLPWRFATADKALEAVTRARATWEGRPLGSIRKGDVQAFVSGLKLAPSTVRVVHQHLVACLGRRSMTS